MSSLDLHCCHHLSLCKYFVLVMDEWNAMMRENNYWHRCRKSRVVMLKERNMNGRVVQAALE